MFIHGVTSRACGRTKRTIKCAILLLHKALYMIRLPSRSLDEAEKLQSGDRLSKPSSESPLRISYYMMKCEITRANYSNSGGI